MRVYVCTASCKLSIIIYLFKVLEEFRLSNFLAKLVELGVTCVDDLADITPEDLKDLGRYWYKRVQVHMSMSSLM